jgi:hypothetical protein
MPAPQKAGFLVFSRELRMSQFPKFETMRKRQGRPSRILVCAHGPLVDSTVDNTIGATNPGRGGGG